MPVACVVLLGVRGQFASDRTVWYGTRAVLVLATNRRGIAIGGDIGDWSKFPRPNGRLSYERGVPDAFAYEMMAVLALNVDPGDTIHDGRLAGVTWFRYVPKNAGYSINRVSAPTWLLALLTATPPGIWWTARTYRDSRHRRRQACGLCFRCGYDLRGSPRRCPECGTAVAISGAAPEGLDNEITARRTDAVAATLSHAAGGAERKGAG